MLNSRKLLIVAGVAVAFAGGGLWLVSSKAPPQDPGEAEQTSGHMLATRKKNSHPSVKKRYVGGKHVSQSVMAPKPVLEWADDDEDDARTPEEKALATRIEKALDEENFEQAVACSKEALTSANTEIRQAMVDTLGWFGVKALPELTPFLIDADDDVRESAQNEWSMALSDIKDDGEKIGAVEMAMHILSDDDFLEDISGEYIGIDEKMAVESILRIVESGGTEKGISKAKETYEFVTGETFTDRAAAEKWIAEEYQPAENP